MRLFVLKGVAGLAVSISSSTDFMRGHFFYVTRIGGQVGYRFQKLDGGPYLIICPEASTNLNPTLAEPYAYIISVNRSMGGPRLAIILRLSENGLIYIL